MTQATIGVDVSKAHLDIHARPMGETLRVTNDAAGFRELETWLAPWSVTRVVFEATGAYHQAFEQTLGDKAFPLVKVNPRQARRFAEATGRLAKTDRVDAAMLAKMGAVLELPSQPVMSVTLRALRELHAARDALIKEQTATKNRRKQITNKLLIRQNEKKLGTIKEDMAAIEEEMMSLISTDPSLQERLNITQSIPGVGRIAAFSMLIDMPELGTMTNKQAASLAGLAPMTRQSGDWNGLAHIRGGRARLRHALFMPTLVAIRHNPDLKATYEALIAAGKPPKVAIVAVMRKLVVLANALLRNGRTWSPIAP